MTIFANAAFAQNGKMVSSEKMTAPKTINLEQTTGEFTIHALTLSEGTYVFEVANNGIDHEVGFVLAPKSNPDQHIKNAYVQKTINDGESSSSKQVTLTKGEYVYFCPLNPTPKYTITVE